MTVEEKRNMVQEHCDESNCNDCCLSEWCDGDYLIKTASEDILDKAIAIINESKNSKVNHPSHYQGKNECIDVMIAMFGVEAVKGFCKCNAYKYRFRAGQKEGNSAEQDIEKAEWYETYLMNLEGMNVNG